MVNIVCDACKKTIQNAEKDVNVFFIGDKNVCSTCKEEMETKVKDKLLKEGNYGFKSYKETMKSILDSMSR